MGKDMSRFILNSLVKNKNAKKFYNDFLNSSKKKFLFGRNIYANKIIEQIQIDGFIDYFYDKKTYLKKYVLKL